MENSVELRLCLLSPAGRSVGSRLSLVSAVVGGGRDTEWAWDALEAVGSTGLGGFDMIVESGSTP